MDDGKLKVMIYDETAKKGGLAFSWFAGGLLYKAVRTLDFCQGVNSWDDALQYLMKVGGDRPIDEIQIWCHGWFGAAYINNEPLIAKTYVEGPLLGKLTAVKNRLHKDSLVWFRSCALFGSRVGQNFALQSANFFRCRVAGHTRIIGPLQSGLYTTTPGVPAYWSDREGVKEDGTPEKSSPFAPHTIHCLNSSIPKGW